MELVGAIAVGLTKYFGRVEADGLENLPMRGPAIVAVNHTSIADVPPVLSTLFRAGLRPSRPCHRPGCGTDHGHVRFLAAAEVFNHWFSGPLARHAGMIEGPAVWRGLNAPGARRSDAGAAAVRAAEEALDDGQIIGIYPEGDAMRPNPDGSPRRFKSGVARLALAAAAPVIPVAHHDAREISSGTVGEAIGRALTSVVRRPTIRLRVGRPVLPEEFAGLPVREVVELIQRRVTDVWRTIAAEVTAGASPGLVEKPL